MHLPRKTNAGNGGAVEVSCLKRSADGKGGSTPPIAGILLGPTRLRTRERGMFLGARPQNPAGFIQHYGASSPCSDINSQDWNKSSVPCRYDARLTHCSVRPAVEQP